MDRLKSKCLRVTGKTFCAGAIFVRENGKWRIYSCAPYLKAIIKDTPIPMIGTLLTSKGFKYEWL